ncbi:hypothetical protein GEMRC1_002749 [Eukaryota sp. GEM-RC1]
MKKQFDAIVNENFNLFQKSTRSNSNEIKNLLDLRCTILLYHLQACFSLIIAEWISEFVDLAENMQIDDRVSGHRITYHFYLGVALEFRKLYDQKVEDFRTAFKSFRARFPGDNDLMIVQQSFRKLIAPYTESHRFVGNHLVNQCLDLFDDSIFDLDQRSQLPDCVDLSYNVLSSYKSWTAFQTDTHCYPIFMNNINFLFVESVVKQKNKKIDDAVGIITDQLLPFYFDINNNLKFSSTVAKIATVSLEFFRIYGNTNFSPSFDWSVAVRVLFELFSEHFSNYRKSNSLTLPYFDELLNFFHDKSPNLSIEFTNPLLLPFSIEFSFASVSSIYPKYITFSSSISLTNNFPVPVKFDYICFSFVGNSSQYDVYFSQADCLSQFNSGNQLVLIEKQLPFDSNNRTLSFSGSFQPQERDSGCEFKLKSVIMTIKTFKLDVSCLLSKSQNHIYYCSPPIKASFVVEQVFPLFGQSFVNIPSVFKIKCSSDGDSVSKSRLYLENFKNVSFWFTEDISAVDYHYLINHKANQASDYIDCSLRSQTNQQSKPTEIYLILLSPTAQSSAINLEWSFKPTQTQSFLIDSLDINVNFFSPLEVSSNSKFQGELIITNSSVNQFFLTLTNDQDITIDPFILERQQIVSRKILTDSIHVAYMLQPKTPEFERLFSEPCIIHQKLKSNLTQSLIKVDFDFPKIVELYSTNQLKINIESDFETNCLISISNRENQFLISGFTTISMLLRTNQSCTLTVNFVPLVLGQVNFPKISFIKSRSNSNEKLTNSRVCSMFCCRKL